jgi:DNA-binding winged helix-turn-helix (wHTH) protein/Flp pilus assembly protein TadD
MDKHASPIYEFNGFRLIPAERLLLRNGGAVPLTHKVFDILLLLVRNRGQLVEKEAMLDAVWPEQFVEQHNLTVSMSALRKALGESPDKHEYIETVPKHGYRFIANVRELPNDSSVQSKRHTPSTEAHHLYLKGRYNWNKRTPFWIERAVQYFEQAIQLDPDYALAYAGLADSYNLMAGNSGLPPSETFPKARAAALKALEIDDTLAEAHTSLALVRYLFDWQWSAAERGFRRAIELNPNYATAHHWYGEYLGLCRRFDVGFKELVQAQELEPLSFPINADLGQYYFFTRRYEQAVEQLTRTLELEPNFVRALALLGWTFEQLGRFDEAIAKFEQATALSGSRTLIVAGLGHAHAVSGNREAALEILEALTEQAKQTYVSPYEVAVIHAALNNIDTAFACLERAFQDRSVWLSWLDVDPRLDALRADVRFENLVARVKNSR